MNSAEHRKLLHEVFVQPIRSILIVDDDYPTYEEILSERGRTEAASAHGAVEKSWKRDPMGVLSVVRSFREMSLPPLIDVHDGKNVDEGGEKKIAKHLHQSDLLVLDYQLDGPSGDGSKATDIIRSVTNNSHFNLVVVHTSVSLQEAFDKILLAMLAPSSERPSEAELSTAQEVIYEAEIEREGLTARLTSSIQHTQYFSARRDVNKAIGLALKGEAPFAEFSSICKPINGWNNGTIRSVLCWCLCEFEKNVMAEMAHEANALVQWSESKVLWIRAGTAFISFTNKARDVNILQDLLEALVDWKPGPSRLFMAKLRAEIDDKGVVAENAVLGNTHVLARWYENLISEAAEGRKTAIGESITRHSEQLVANIRNEVEDFAHRLVDLDAKRFSDKIDVIKDYFSIDLSNSAKRRLAERDHNIFVCSKPISGWHLHTGHVFECGGAIWVCLSPACDLVPRHKADRTEDLGDDIIPFLAVKLHDCGDGLADIKDIQSNRYVYLSIRNEPRLFSFTKDANANPYWRAMYALNQGRFGENLEFQIHRVAKDQGKLSSTVGGAKIVGQLRYEYALNLVQKLGVSFTRVGLDFSGN